MTRKRTEAKCTGEEGKRRREEGREEKEHTLGWLWNAGSSIGAKGLEWARM
jgi:hypothetical protein